MLNWVDIDDQTQQRMMEVKRLHDTGYHEEVLDTKTPYEIYLSKAEELLGSVNRGKISTEKYRFEIQLLMRNYADTIEHHSKRLMEDNEKYGKKEA